MIVSDDEIITALREQGSNRKAASSLGINQRTLERRRKALAAKGWSPEHGYTHSVPDGYKVKGVSTLYRDDGSIAAQWVKSSADAEYRERAIREAVSASIEDLPKLPKRTAPGGSFRSDLMTCYPIGDAHIGMRAWREETGADWDLAIAERVQCGAMDQLVQGAPATETATIVNLGDFLHYDSMAPVTSRSGNVLDADGRYAKMIRVGIKVMRQCIESALSKHQRVHVVNVVGNHDETGALWLSAALAHMYEREPRVTVDTSPALFSYVEFGSVLLGFHHGHTCKPDKLPGVMAADMPEAWGRTKHRYWWLGHVHHQSVMEYPGVTVETFNTLATRDAYATAGGWRSRENMKAIVIHRDHGEVGRNTVNPAMLAA